MKPMKYKNDYIMGIVSSLCGQNNIDIKYIQPQDITSKENSLLVCIDNPDLTQEFSVKSLKRIREFLISLPNQYTYTIPKFFINNKEIKDTYILDFELFKEYNEKDIPLILDVDYLIKTTSFNEALTSVMSLKNLDNTTLLFNNKKSYREFKLSMLDRRKLNE